MKKKSLFAVILVFFIIGFTFITPRANAASMSIGPYVWFAWWQPAFRNWMKGDQSYSMIAPAINRKFTMNPNFLYGPMLAFNFNDKISFSNIFIYGNYKCESRFIRGLINTTLLFPNKNKQLITRYDLDSTLNFTINKFVKIFLGFKYLHYTFNKNDFAFTGVSSGAIIDWKINRDSLGGGLGIGITIPLVENFGMIWSLSALYQKPIEKVTKNGIAFMGATIYPIKSTFKPKYHSIGGNTNLSFAYYIEKASLTIAAGFRYQYMYLMGKNISPEAFDLMLTPFNLAPKMANQHDHFYGLVMSVVYTLDFLKV